MRKVSALDEQGHQWFWKITLTALGAVVGAILTLWLAGVW
jgi:hypothetical protein